MLGLTEDELNWIRQVLSDPLVDDLSPSPSYDYVKKTEFERNKNKGNVRKELDALRKELIGYAPEELIELRMKREREKLGIENFAGIYIIHNLVYDIYYIGQAKKVFDRAYKHFVTNPSENKARYEWTVEYNLPEIYDDYRLGDKFNISLISLKQTSFSSLNEFEDNAIRAYNSLVPHGYNRMPGNILDKPIFKNDDYEKAANLLLDKIKGSLPPPKKRMSYTLHLLSELECPRNTVFALNFIKLIKAYQKANRK